MVNIGGDIGALIIHTDSRWHGYEIEVSRVAAPEERVHAAVRARNLPGSVSFCVLIDALREGSYLIWQDAVEPLARVDVRGGSVAEYTWPADAVPSRGLLLHQPVR
jgi:hypothetical protein